MPTDSVADVSTRADSFGLLRAPRTVGRRVTLPSLPDRAWRRGVAVADHEIGRPGVADGTGRHVVSGRSGRLQLTSCGVADGVRIEVEHTRLRSWPWLSSAGVLAVIAVVWSGLALALPSVLPLGWAVVVGAAAVTVALAASLSEWRRSLGALSLVDRVILAVEQTAVGVADQALPVTTSARLVLPGAAATPSPDPIPFVVASTPLASTPSERTVPPVQPPPSARPIPDALSMPSTSEEETRELTRYVVDMMQGFGGATSATDESEKRGSLGTIRQATAERQGTVPDGFAEWTPS